MKEVTHLNCIYHFENDQEKKNDLLIVTKGRLKSKLIPIYLKKLTYFITFIIITIVGLMIVIRFLLLTIALAIEDKMNFIIFLYKRIP